MKSGLQLKFLLINFPKTLLLSVFATVANLRDALEDISESSKCLASASAKWQIKGLSQGLSKQAGRLLGELTKSRLRQVLFC